MPSSHLTSTATLARGTAWNIAGRLLPLTCGHNHVFRDHERAALTAHISAALHGLPPC